MKVQFYYNFSCPHCYFALQNLLEAKKRCNMKNLDIEFIPTNRRMDDVECIREYLQQYNISEKFVFERGQNLHFANQVLAYCEDKVTYYLKIAEAYFLKYLNITDEAVVKNLCDSYSEEDFNKIRKIKLNISEENPTTIKIGEVEIQGIKDVNYYEFALSCFYNEELEIPFKEEKSICDGKCCE